VDRPRQLQGRRHFHPEGWGPTAEKLNALPDFIHALQRSATLPGMIRENVLIKEENYALRRMIAELKGIPSRLPAG
jgi:hypothetical protein